MSVISERADGAIMVFIPKDTFKYMRDKHGWRTGRRIVIVPTERGSLEILGA